MNEKQLQKRNVCDLQTVLKTVQGRRVLWRILQACQLRRHAFVAGDAYATAFQCGQQSIGLFVLGEIEDASCGAYAQMRGEYLSEVTSKQNEINRKNEEITNE
ncbi:MAG: hypothetical protein ACI351_07650 [Candidatus Avelusimicrobium sp.]|uniref:Bbp19 family protein n=1 Tax=Candidatus Avelusimicrobium sp. TaxID=3048833 RepID=UPI003F122B1B